MQRIDQTTQRPTCPTVRLSIPHTTARSWSTCALDCVFMCMTDMSHSQGCCLQAAWVMRGVPATTAKPLMSCGWCAEPTDH